MILRAVTSVPLIGLALLWFCAAAALAGSFRLFASGVLAAVAVPVAAGGATLWVVWRFRETTAERAAGRILLAGAEAFCLFAWAGWMLGWGGGV